MEAQDFNAVLQEKVQAIDNVITSFLPGESSYANTVISAMNYSVLAGGKRLRPLLLQETYRMLGGRDDDIFPFMAAIEMIHTYSLVHDDLPAMDNDTYRRGRETTWKVYGDAMGVLAGDGLLNFAFETALNACVEAEPQKQVRMISALQILAGKSGIYGMIGGQAEDIAAEGKPAAVSEEQLLYIHEHKTAALIQAAMMMGAVLAGATEETIHLLEQCAGKVGVAFQIQDDILDVIGDSAELGKQVGSDAQNQKQTYVTMHGLEKAKRDVAALTGEAMELLEATGGEQLFLRQLIERLINRRK